MAIASKSDTNHEGGVYIIKADGEREIFQREKLIESLQRVGTTSQVIDKIVTHIESDLMDDMSTTDIYRHAFALLRKYEQRVVARYSLRRALIGLGPTGFPFEDYIGEIFKAQGYKVEVGKIVKGHCVPHEVDLIAYNDSRLLMGEIKFHNELGYKTDLKVALYVKSRIDDLKASSFFYGGKSRKLDEGLLITNTKFTQTAIDYGTCSGMTMIGWNYPAKGSLQELIEASGLHPLSCLSSLTVRNKHDLFQKKVVLCKSLLEDPTLLTSIGIRGDQLNQVIEEIKTLY